PPLSLSGGLHITAAANMPHYDPLPDARKLVSALTSGPKPDTSTLIEILPRLRGSEILALRSEHKRIYRNVHLVKHLKKELSGAFGKIAWICALGPYESEGWWANTWYQKSITKDDILIEALMGKTLHEIREIKKGFRDAKYGNDLVRALQAELPA